MDTIGERLAFARKKIALSTRNVEQITGISKSNISKVENDHHHPSAKMLTTLSELYNVSTDWILFGSPNPQLQKDDDCLGLTPLSELANPELRHFILEIIDQWVEGDEEFKGWIIVQLRRAFPDIAEKYKKATSKEAASAESA